MSNKYTDNNDKQTQNSAMQKQSDEAFINELYNEVSEEDQSQPSEFLDHRIINAAHKEINESNKPKKNSHFKWYSSLATAASLTLVISLVVLQQSNVLTNEKANNMLKHGITLQKSMTSINDNESFADQEVVAEKMAYQAQASYSAIPNQMTSSIANTTKVAAKEKMVRATQYKKKAQLSKQKSTERMMASEPVNSVSLAKLASTPEVYEKHKVIPLSIKQLQQYILSNNNLTTEKQWLWSLTSENNMAYMISIYQNKLQPLQYSLDKSTYKIIVKAKEDNKEPSLKNKNLLEITIINR